MKPLRYLALASSLALVPGALQAQTRFATKDLSTLLKGLSDDQAWWQHREALVERARDARIKTLAPLSAQLRQTKDTKLRERSKIVLDAIVAEYLEIQKERERKTRMQALDDALDDLKQARPDQRDTAMRGLSLAIASMRESVKSKAPIDAPPLRVPAEDSVVPVSPLEGMKSIPFGEQTVLVPAEVVRDGKVTHIEQVDGQLRVMTFDSEAAKQKYLARKQTPEEPGESQQPAKPVTPRKREK